MQWYTTGFPHNARILPYTTEHNLVIHYQYLAQRDRDPDHLMFNAITPTVIRGLASRRRDTSLYFAADGSTAEPGRPGLGQHVILVLVIRELDLMKHSERLSIAAEPNDVLA